MDHVRKCCAAAVKCGRKISGNHSVPFFNAHIRQKSHPCDSGIVDEYVKTGAGHFNLVKDTSDFGWNTYISWEDFAGTGGFLCDKISSSLQFTDGFAAV